MGSKPQQARGAAVSHVVLYRWKLKTDREDDFVAAWARLTDVLKAESGSYGSRLHRCSDGTYLAYGYWPSRQAWETSQIQAPKSAARALMAAAIEERFPEQHMELIDDRVDAPPFTGGHPAADFGDGD
jgi:heme-degrading monooxygenase HmoA